ncbi:unnamed protein product [Rotaria sp. Silwood2]|nr:unnamed protein product [Rotaria sp. Silwood2]CAF2870178.1 unnamed protein product [Rotaria sp. Silwood2]CAF3932983.1 unnamed protein product [Rotaria sp. Silwood2]CAF4377948.1 unnamed protein product [Rotaria sp. Silwood2]
MSNIDFSSTNTSTRRIYQRRNRKRNRTSTVTTLDYLPLTTTIVTTNSTLLLNSSSIPINDLFAPLSYLLQHKYIFLIGLSLLIVLCLISILFLIFILKCTRRKGWKTRRQIRLDRKRLEKSPDFLDDQHKNKDENTILLEPNGEINSFTNNNPTITNGIFPSDNISSTISIGSILEKKIIENNPPNSIPLLPITDNTSIDTLRGSLISSPSQQISVNQQPSTPSYITTTDSATNPDERDHEAEKDDYLHDFEFKPITSRYTKAINNSGSNMLAHRSSGSSIEQSIRRQERRAEEEERGLLHGSNSNLYEKEIRRLAEQEKNARKEHTNSQVSLTSRTSEDSCY